MDWLNASKSRRFNCDLDDVPFHRFAELGTLAHTDISQRANTQAKASSQACQTVVPTPLSTRAAVRPLSSLHGTGLGCVI